MKLIFFDIDGTLIEEQRKGLSDSTKKAIAKAQENGHICIVNTGRSNCIVGNWLPQQAAFDGYLCGCGTHIIYKGETLLHKTFSELTASYIIKGLEKYHIDAALEGADNNYVQDPDEMHTTTFKNYITQFKGYGTYTEAIGRFDKFYCFSDKPEEMAGFAEEYEEVLDFIDRERGFFEVVPKGFSKATAIEMLAEKLGVPMEDTVAIGDSNNDLQMLQCAHTAIAMGNAVDAVKEIADFVTTDVNDDGIWNALSWLGVL